MKYLLFGIKNTISQTYDKNTTRIPVTTIAIPQNYLVGIKFDKNRQIQICSIGISQNKTNKKPQMYLTKRTKSKLPLNTFSEFKNITENIEDDKQNTKTILIKDQEIKVGDFIDPTLLLKEGDTITIKGISKGKGFQGVVKRHGFSGGPKTHGQSDRHRAPGSIGTGTTPGRVFKGKKMAGRMGGDTITIKNLNVVSVSQDEIKIKGIIPGTVNSLVKIIYESNQN